MGIPVKKLFVTTRFQNNIKTGLPKGLLLRGIYLCPGKSASTAYCVEYITILTIFDLIHFDPVQAIKPCHLLMILIGLKIILIKMRKCFPSFVKSFIDMLKKGKFVIF